MESLIPIFGRLNRNVRLPRKSKAFDKVNHSDLLLKLVQGNIPDSILCIFENWFNNCYTCVKWKSIMSSFFIVEFGVRQGSALLPHIFSIYFNDNVSRFNTNQRLVMFLYADNYCSLCLQLLNFNYCFTNAS